MIFLNLVSETDPDLFVIGKRYYINYQNRFQWGLMLGPFKNFNPLCLYVVMQPQYYGPNLVYAKDIYDVVTVCDCCGRLI